MTTTVQVRQRGTFTLPAEIRQKYGIEPGDTYQVLDLDGKPFDPENIGAAIATRELLADLRAGGEFAGGPAPIEKRDRSRFLQRLDEEVQSIRRSSGEA